MSVHNEANIEDVAKTVIMPGDPLRAKYIAYNFLTDIKLINSVRNMFGYTGYYKGNKVTIFASGMGMPSMGIYSYELYKFYNVENIIRIGSCGAYSESLNLFDTLLVDKSYTEGNFALALEGIDCHIADATPELNSIIMNEAKYVFGEHIYNADNISDNDNAKKLVKCNVLCNECFDYYVKDIDEMIARFPKDLNLIGCEMESFALFYTAKYLNKNAACLLTVVDSHYKHQEISTEDREKSLNDMIVIALESAAKLN